MFEYWMETDLTQLPEVDKGNLFFTQDGGANKIGVIVTNDGESVTLSGSIKAWIILPDGTTIQENGSKSGNRAWVVLPDDAYDDPGQISIFIKLLSGNDVITLGGVEGYIHKSR